MLFNILLIIIILYLINNLIYLHSSEYINITMTVIDASIAEIYILCPIMSDIFVCKMTWSGGKHGFKPVPLNIVSNILN